MIVGTTNEEVRLRWIEERLAAIPRGNRILDAGAGEQRFRQSCGHLEYVSQDFAEYDGSGDQSGLQMGTWDNSGLDIICDITDIPEPNASFDSIICTEVLEHLPNPLEAIQEFSRLLKPGGDLILTAPFCSLTHFAPYHYATGFNRYFYELQLPSHGFDIVELTPNGNFFEYLAQELRRLHSVADRYTEEGLAWLDWQALRRIFRTLERASAEGSESSELLCYGYHVLARKRSL